MANGPQIVIDPETGQERPERYPGEAGDIKTRQAAEAAGRAVGDVAGAVGSELEPMTRPIQPGMPRRQYTPGERTGVSREQRPPQRDRLTWDPMSTPDEPLPTPSRATMISIHRGTQGLDDPGGQKQMLEDIEEAMQREFAKNVASDAAAGQDVTASTPTPPPTPTDVKEPKAGTGPPVPGQEERDPYYGGDQSFKERQGRGIYSVRVKGPDGRERIIRTNRPAGHIAGGAEYAPFSEGMAGDSDVVGGAGGTLYAGSGAGAVDMPASDMPQDRSPGWAARAALRAAHAQGSGLSMDPRDIMDRRRFEEQEMGRDLAMEAAEIESAKQRLGLVAAERAAMVDPYVMAEIEAQGKYGGAMLQEQAAQRRQTQALALFKDISDKIDSYEKQLQGLDPQSAQAAALKQAIDRMVQERRELANIALGFRINDPRQSDLMAMLGVLGGLGTPGAGQGGNEGE